MFPKNSEQNFCEVYKKLISLKLRGSQKWKNYMPNDYNQFDNTNVHSHLFMSTDHKTVRVYIYTHIHYVPFGLVDNFKTSYSQHFLVCSGYIELFYVETVKFQHPFQPFKFKCDVAIKVSPYKRIEKRQIHCQAIVWQGFLLSFNNNDCLFQQILSWTMDIFQECLKTKITKK